MNASIGLLARSILFAVLSANVLAAVPTAISVEGHVTAIDSHSIQIEGISYALEPGSEAARDLANVHRGDVVTLSVSPAGAGHAASRASTQMAIAVVHAPGVR